MRNRSVQYAIVFVIMLGAALGVSSCDGDDEASGGPGDERVSVGLVVPSLQFAYFRSMREGAEAAAKRLGVDLSVGSGETGIDFQEQINQVDVFLTQQVDGLVVAPASPPEFRPTLQEAVDMDIPVVLADIPDDDFDDQTAYVGTDNLEGGRRAGEYVAEELGGSGTVGVLTLPTDPGVQSRVKGFRQTAEAAGLEVVGVLPTDCNLERGLSASEDLLTANPDLDAIFSACGLPAISAARAARAAGIDRDEILIVGFDASAEEAPFLRSGLEDASIGQFPYKMGEEAVEAVYAAIQGEKVQPTINTGVEIVTKANLEQYQKANDYSTDAE